MKRFSDKLVTYATGLALVALVSPVFSANNVNVLIDWTKSEGKVNRPLFSTQGFMQVYVEPDAKVLETFKLINPTDTMTRLETYYHQMEPENDNDDPNTFNWEKLKPQEMIRFIKDRDTFEKVYRDELGMETLSLLCYQNKWNESGDPDWPIKSIEEWAEFAAAVVESYNGSGDDYQLNLRYAQVWNEPNMTMFYTGTPESYYELFNTVAERIHRDYPGVMVGGPTITHSGLDPEAWMNGFFENCGENADYIIFHHYGGQGEGHQVLVDSIKRYAEQFRAIPGKENGKVMITETDGWFQGWEKSQFILDRQFGFLEIEDLTLAVHHFCCLSYNESGNYEFGIVDKQGSVVGGTFWPYWLFRNYVGEKAYTLVGGEKPGDLNLAASFDERDGSLLASAVLHNESDSSLAVETFLQFEPATKDRILATSRLTAQTHGVHKVQLVPAGESTLRYTVDLKGGEAVALTLQESGKRHFAFRDLNNQENPWIYLVAEKRTLDFRETTQLKTRLFNTTTSMVSGELELEGVPKEWTVKVVSGDTKVKKLAFNESVEVIFKITADTLVPAGLIAPYVVLDQKGVDESNLDQAAYSIPVTINLDNPISVIEFPRPVYATQGVVNRVEFKIANQITEAFEGAMEVTLPEGMELIQAPGQFAVRANKTAIVGVDFNVSDKLEPGRYTGSIKLSVLGTLLNQEFAVEVAEPIGFKCTPVDLSEDLNFDALSFHHNRRDIDSEMGTFSFPADYIPSGRQVNVRGMDFLMPSLDDGKKNVLSLNGQTIEVEKGLFNQVAFMGFGYDGKHPGVWKFHYADGLVEEVSSQVPEWCVTPPVGTLDAFNSPSRYILSGTAPPACQYWIWTLGLNGEKELVGIEMPDLGHGAHIAAITLLSK